jgi:23S rRNA pseudouridine1911/1915/1917 synthase
LAPEIDDKKALTVKWVVSPDEANVRIDQLIPSHVGNASRAQAKKWIEKGRVRVNGKAIRPSRLLRAGEEVEVDVPPTEPAEPQPENIPVAILHEDQDLVVVNKPPHMVVHPAAGHTSGTLVNALLYHCSDLSGIGGVARPGIVHRLDRGTSGLIVAAKNDRAHRAVARQFANRSVEKLYLALVYGSTPAELRIDRPIGRDPVHRKKISSRSRRPKSAVTEARKIEALPLSTFLSVRITTGRTHQIRVHLSEAGFPVVGDPDYGRARRHSQGGAEAFSILRGLTRPALHAARLAFRHPRTGEELHFEAPIAADILEVLDALRQLAK